MSDKITCSKCGRDDAMIKHENGEYVCHHTHILAEETGSVMENVATIAVEDLITVVCETFIESLEELGYKTDRTVKDWYMGLVDEERREVSTLLLGIIEEDIKSHKECKCESSKISPRVCECGTGGCCS